METVLQSFGCEEYNNQRSAVVMVFEQIKLHYGGWMLEEYFSKICKFDMKNIHQKAEMIKSLN